MMTNQVTVGFDVKVNIQEIAKVLEAHFGNTDVGQGVLENGLPFGFIHVANKKRKKTNG
jgi:hypothetical protein